MISLYPFDSLCLVIVFPPVAASAAARLGGIPYTVFDVIDYMTSW